MKHFLAIATLIFMTIHDLQAQCSGFPATLAESDCGTGTSLTSGANMNSGTYSFCGSSPVPTVFTGLNLNGATLTICGNVHLSGNWNSGNIIVSCGSTVTFPAGFLMNNLIKVVNYGRVNVTGNLEFQNINNCFYNERTTSALYVSGSIIFPQNNNQPAYLKNNGYISVGHTFDARNGGFSCFGDEGRLETVNFNYGNNCYALNDHFTFSGTTGTAILRYTGTAVLYASLTSSTRYAINKGSFATHSFTCTGSWGSAAVATNSPAILAPVLQVCAATTPNCATTLPVTLTGFEVIATGSRVDAYWTTVSEHNSDYFTLERSPDATSWEPMASIPAQGNSTDQHDYLNSDYNPLRGVSYYRLQQFDKDGTKTLSETRSVIVQPEASFVLYPNPADDAFMLLPAATVRILDVVIADASGRPVQEIVYTGEGLQIVDIRTLPGGFYVVSVTLSNGITEQRQVVLN